MRNFLKRYICLVLALVLLCFPGCSQPEKKAEPTEQEAPTQQIRQQREGIQTLLVMFLDEFEVPENTGYRNRYRADMLMLLVVDEAQAKTTAIQINPDTMVSFTVPGTASGETMPLGLVHSYGSGGSDSCLNQRKAISELLGGVSIDHYMTFTVDSIGIVNDMIGGVTVSVTEDFRNAYPEIAAEETLTLSAENSAEFFRYRNAEDHSNEEHMERQRRYIAGMYGPFMEHAQEEDFLTKLTLQLGETFTTDLTLSQMVQMMELLGTYALDETIVTIQGTAEKTDGQFMFWADEKSLEQAAAMFFE